MFSIRSENAKMRKTETESNEQKARRDQSEKNVIFVMNTK